MKQLAIVLLALFAATSALADECVEGEYVISVLNINALRDKALIAANTVSNEPLLLMDENPRAILVEELSSVLTKDEVVPYDRNKDLCLQIRKSERVRRRVGDRVRRLTCSCNGVFKAVQNTNDTYYYLQWALNQPNDIDIDAPEAWQMARGSSSIVVGVIDTGILYTHPDLAANIWRNDGEIPGNGIDDDGNGYIDDVRGLNAITYNGFTKVAGDPIDDNGHGTHVAGTIGAATNNGSGVAGVMWNVKMVPIKFLGADGSGSLMDAIEAIDYATTLKRKGVNLVLTNNSWGGGGAYQPLYEAIQAAKAEGILFVAAAGNESQDTDASPRYPASYNLDNIISVAAVTRDGGLASFSNYGAASVDIGAPGQEIASTYLHNSYVYLSGTSMAAPHVAGGLALLKSYSYGLSWQEMKQVLYSSGDSYPALAGRTATGKMMNLHRMLQSVPANPVPPPGGSQPQPTPTPTIVPTPTPLPQPTPTLPPGNWNINGLVTLGSTPLSGSRVELRIGTEIFVRMTDANGGFNFIGIRGPAEYTLHVTRSGYSFPVVSGFLSQNVTHNISATARTFWLTVQAYSPLREPIGGIAVNAGDFGSAVTDSQGRARFQIPVNTNYQISLSSDRYNLVETILSGALLGDTTRVAIARQP